MAEISGFFTAELVDGVYDRQYVASEFAKYFSKFIGNGIYANPATQLQVLQNDEGGMKVNISIGDAFINGYWYQNSTVVTKQISAASGTVDRIDRIVLRWSKANRAISIEVVEGTPATSAQAPDLTRSADTYELCLADISVTKALTTITDSKITDRRFDSTLCGTVAGVVSQIDATNLFAQYTATFNEFYTSESTSFTSWMSQQQSDFSSWRTTEQNGFDSWQTAEKSDFDAWFANVQGQLSGDVAGNLANKITILEGRADASEANIATLKASFSEQNYTIPLTGWVLNSTTGRYELNVTITGITESDIVDINLDDPSRVEASNCNLGSSIKSSANAITLYSDTVPVSEMIGTITISKVVN